MIKTLLDAGFSYEEMSAIFKLAREKYFLMKQTDSKLEHDTK